MSSKNKRESKFTHAELDSLINFVGTHKELYVNPRDTGKRELRDSLWVELGHRLNKSPKLCRYKFRDLRDQFVRNLKKTKPTRLRPHAKKMIFLLEIHPELRAKAELAMNANHDDDADDGGVGSDASSVDDCAPVKHEVDFVDVPSIAALPESNNHNDQMTTFDTFEASNAQSPDVLDRFLLGLGATIRTFPQMEIAKLKLELSTLVFNREMVLAANRMKRKDFSGGDCYCNCHSANSD